MSSFISTYDTEITFIICAMFGGIMHYLKKYMKGETEAMIHEWYGKDNLAATVYTITVFFFAIIGAIAADVINEKTGFFAAMYSGFVTGFSIDAGFNGDARQMNRDLIDTKQNLTTFLGDGSKDSPSAPPTPSAPPPVDVSGAPVEGAPTPDVVTPAKPVVRPGARLVYRPKSK